MAVPTRSLAVCLGDAELAQRVRIAAPHALKNSCNEAADAYDAHRYSDGFSYGVNRWRFGLGWVADTLEEKCDGTIAKLGHLRLGIIGLGAGCLVYPIAVGKTAVLDLQALRIKPSKLRLSLLSPPQIGDQLTLDYDADADHGKVSPRSPGPAGLHLVPDAAAADVNDLVDAEASALEDVAVAGQNVAGIVPAGRVVLLLLYTSNPRNGLLAAAIGEATMAEDGYLTFLWCEHLPVTGDGGNGGLRIVVEDPPTGPDFHSAAEPDLPVTARTAERAAGAEADAISPAGTDGREAG